MSGESTPSANNNNKHTRRVLDSEAAFGCPRDFVGNRFVYILISARARGLSVGINMNPDKFCNFNCLYCEVNRDIPPVERELDVPVMAGELERTLHLIESGGIQRITGYSALREDLTRLRHVAFSGDGEPTLCAKFAEAVEAVVHLRAKGFRPFYKLVLISNGSCLDLAPVQAGLKYFTHQDEVWIKLDAGSRAYMERVNRTEVSLEKIMENALVMGRKRPIVIQSLFPLIGGEDPPVEEIDEYLKRLKELKGGGAVVSLVQVYSASRPVIYPECSHAKLQLLTHISRRIKNEVGFNAEVF